MDHHTIAAVSITGIGLDVLGGLYLAYDLLGGQGGPLRLLTRAVTYAIVFGIGYGMGLGLYVRLATGAATGVTLAIELQRAARTHDHYPLRWEAVFSALRGLAFTVGLYSATGFPFAITFGALLTAGQIVAYTRGMRPSLDYAANARPRLTRRQLWGVAERTVGYIVAALLCSAAVGHLAHAWSFALRLGLVSGLVTRWA